MALEVEKVLKHRAGRGFQGAQTGWGGYDDWESKGQGGDTGVRKRRSWKWMGDEGGVVVKCLGQIILGRQSIFPGIQTHLHANNHTTSFHPS